MGEKDIIDNEKEIVDNANERTDGEKETTDGEKETMYGGKKGQLQQLYGLGNWCRHRQEADPAPFTMWLWVRSVAQLFDIFGCCSWMLEPVYYLFLNTAIKAKMTI